MRFKMILITSSITIAMLLVAPAFVVAEGDTGHEASAATREGAETHEADGHGGVHLNWLDFSNEHTPPLAAMFFNFVLVGILVYLILRKPMGSKIRLRKETLVQALDEAKVAKEEADKALAVARKKQEELSLEMDRIREVILEGGAAEAKRIVDEAEARSRRMSQDTSALVEQEIARMSQSLKAELVEEIVAAAKDAIVAKIQAGDHDKLASEYLESMGKATPTNADRQ